MSVYVTKMKQLSLINKKYYYLYDNLEEDYKKADEAERKALDDNAEIIFEQYLFSAVQNINSNVKTLTTIAIIYVIVSVIAGIYIFSTLS